MFADAEILAALPNSLRELMTFERRYLDRPGRFRDIDSDAGFDARYFPENCGVVKLPCYWVSRRCLYVYGRQLFTHREPALFSGTGLHERVLFAIHPASHARYGGFLKRAQAEDATAQGLTIWAVPTSSTRTFLAWPDGSPERAVFFKTSLYSPILGDRRLDRNKVACSVGLSAVMQESASLLPGDLSFLPEPVGYIPRTQLDGGMVVRSVPQELVESKSIPVPLFSLMSRVPQQEPLLMKMHRNGGVDPLEFVEDVLCARFARLWLETYVRLGLILEAHGQDLMLELSPDLSKWRRFLYRDFEGLQVDWQLRRALGLVEPSCLGNRSAWHETYETWGYPTGAMVSYKLRISLYDYLHFVLMQMNASLLAWMQEGALPKRALREDTLTSWFSEHMFRAIDQMFGVRERCVYDVHRYLNRFVIFLMKVRREVVARGLPSRSA